MNNPIKRRSWFRATAALVLTACMFAAGIAHSEAAGKGKVKGPGAFQNSINLVPTVTSLQITNGELLASGTVTATLKGNTYTSPFTAPVNIALADDQTGAGGCPILDLTLGPIDLNLLGLAVETSPICLQIVAHDGEGLLGDLLCSVANLLQGGLSLTDILNGLDLTDPLTGAVVIPGLTSGELNDLLAGVTDLLNGVLGNLLDGILGGVDAGDNGTCGILHLELGPLDLTLLGLQVTLDDCAGGPVVVDISAVPGPGNLLGNLLCELLGGNSINLGTTLQGLLNQILALLNA